MIEKEKYTKEIQLAILGVIAGLGFFKIDELVSFITVLNYTLNTNGVDKHNLFLLIFIPTIFLLYLLYLISFIIALIKLYKGQNIFKIILFTITFYFSMYFLLIIVMLNNPKLFKKETKTSYETSLIIKADNTVYS